MFDDNSFRQIPVGQPSRRDIDIATGILVGLRGYSERDAFGELVDVVQRTGSGITAVARALIAGAGGRSSSAQTHSDALAMWGDVVLGHTAPRRPAAAS